MGAGGAGGGGMTGAAGMVPMDQPHSMGGSTWTVLVYMVADNDLEPFALDDLKEMMAVGSSAGFNLVVEVDRAPGYSSDPIGGIPDFTDTKRVLVKQGSLQELADLGELDMANPKTLSDFVTWGEKTYPADRTAVVFWDHGGGWMGFGLDESSQSLLGVPALEQGLAKGLGDAGAKPLAFVGFDACLMATWEVAATLAPHAEYLVASEETEPGHGWDWTALQTIAQNPAVDPVTVGKDVIRGFIAQATAQKTVDAVTLGLIDLYRLAALGKALDAIAGAFDGTPATVTAFAKAQDRAQAFGESPDATQAQNLIDIGSFAHELAAAAPSLSALETQVTTALAAAVVTHAQGAGRVRSTGMAIYFPPNKALYRAGYDNLAAAVDWRALLKAYFGSAAASTVAPMFTNPQKVAATRTAADGSFVVDGTLQADTVSSLSRAILDYGLVTDTQLVIVGEEPATVTGATVEGSWDLSALTLTQGTNVGYGTAIIEQVDATHVSLSIVFAYHESAVAPAQSCVRQLVFSVDAGGNYTLASDTYYVESAGVFGELSPTAGSTLMSEVEVIDLGTGQTSMQDGSTQAFTPTLGADGRQTFDLTIATTQFVTGSKVFASLSVENAAGDGDAVLGELVVP
jgi:hypothetical protein